MITKKYVEAQSDIYRFQFSTSVRGKACGTHYLID